MGFVLWLRHMKSITAGYSNSAIYLGLIGNTFSIKTIWPMTKGVCHVEKSEPNRPKRLSLKRPPSKVGPWLVSGNLKFGRVPTILLRVTHPDCTNDTVYAEHLLSFWEPAILAHD